METTRRWRLERHLETRIRMLMDAALEIPNTVQVLIWRKGD